MPTASTTIVIGAAHTITLNGLAKTIEAHEDIAIAAVTGNSNELEPSACSISPMWL